MPARRKPPIREEDVGSLGCLKSMARLTSILHACAPSANRILRYDHLMNLLLLMFFNPVITSLRDLSALSGLKKVREKLGTPSFGKSTIAEAMRVFDPSLLAEVVGELAGRVPERGCEALKDLGKVLEGIDGTLLDALPRMTWALWIDEDNRAAKLHVCFDVLKEVPTVINLTEATGRETDFERDNLKKGHLYITDRGYEKYSVFQEIMDAGASFVCRIRSDSVMRAVEEKALSDCDRKCGIARDPPYGGLGADPEAQGLLEPVRVVEIEADTRDGMTRMLIRRTADRFDISAEIVALIYPPYGGKVELFFRWLKHTLNFRHLLSDTRNGVTIQVYAAIIATLLVAIIGRRKPNKRVYVMISLYLVGLASEEELINYIRSLPLAEGLGA